MAANGQLPATVLDSIGHGFRLRHNAAKYFLLMADEAQYLYGHRIAVRDAYRVIAEQWRLWRLYLAGRGNLAAEPGHSNHGLGVAIDLFDETDRAILDKIGAKYGWSKSHSDAPGEWWHIKWDAALVDTHAIAKAAHRVHVAKLRIELGKRRQQYYHGKLKPGAKRWVARRIRSIKKALGAK